MKKEIVSNSSLIPHLSYLKRKTACRFTLIELLIVVAIIAILAGMLLPALNRARESALKIACVSNHKTLAGAAIQYNMDNQDYFYAPTKADSWNSIYRISAYVLPLYLGKKTGENVDGGLLHREKINGENLYLYTSKVMVCPGRKLDPNRDVMIHTHNYGWNQHLGSGPNYNTSYTWLHQKLGSVRQPSRILMYGDAGGDRWGAYNTLEREVSWTGFSNYASHARHGSMVLFSYTDGHAEPTKTNRPVFYKHASYKEFTENKP
ncbi:MAG: type II secretion system protein [Lentisphaerae bacterium]|nr:type II secretion system protein [Lentisphaerota bacterium]